jgi:hypothetical protein
VPGGHPDECGRDGGKSLSAPREAETVSRRGRKADAGPAGVAEYPLRLGSAWCDLRSLPDELHSDIADLSSRQVEPSYGLSQERDPSRAGPRGIGGTELAAEIAKPCGRQQGVADRVGDDVAVGMADETPCLVGPQKPGEPERATVRQGMDIDTYADALRDGLSHRPIVSAKYDEMVTLPGDRPDQVASWET